VARSLLLIDDDSMVGRFIGHAAEECGYRATRTTGIESFRHQLRAGAPDAVALDLRIPGSDGIEIIRFLAEESYRGLVIVISGLEQRLVHAAVRLGEAMGLHMADPLQKPFRSEELARLLADAGAGEPR